MQKWIASIVACVPAAAWAVEEPVRSNVTTTTWEIYGAVAATLVVGGLWLAWQNKKQKDRQRRRNQGSVLQR